MISTWYLGVKCFREPHIVVAVLGVVELNGILQVTLRRIHDVKIAIGIVNSDDDHVVTVFELVYEVFGEGTSYGASANLARSRHSGATAEMRPYLSAELLWDMDRCKGFGRVISCPTGSNRTSRSPSPPFRQIDVSR
jgi:hypothetical protein